jgi:hypothetical protein
LSIDLAASFASETRNALHIFGAWPPGDVMEIGTFGILDGALFHPLGNITKLLGTEISPRPAGPKLQFDFKSAGTSETRVNVGAAADGGSTSGSGKVTTKLAFKNGGSTYFRTKDTVYHTISNLDDVNKAIMAAFAAGTWRGQYALVHGVFRSAGTTIIISSEDHAEIELEGVASSGGGALDLADASVDIGFKQERDIAFKVIAKAGLTPLMCLSQIRPRNKWLALLGWSEEIIRPLLAGADSGAGATASDNVLTQLAPEISPDQATELGMRPDDVFHMVEFE